MNATARGPRIGPEKWQTLLGVGGGSSPGPRPTDEQTRSPCPDCGLARHAHERRRVYDGDGRYYYQLNCPK